MKAILKTIKPINNIDYKETFNSEQNIRIRGILILKLQKSMKLHFCPLVSQLTKWLNSLHKSRHTQSKLKSTEKIAEDNRRIHNNSQIQDVNIKLTNIYIYFFCYHISYILIFKFFMSIVI